MEALEGARFRGVDRGKCTSDLEGLGIGVNCRSSISRYSIESLSTTISCTGMFTGDCAGPHPANSNESSPFCFSVRRLAGGGVYYSPRRTDSRRWLRRRRGSKGLRCGDKTTFLSWTDSGCRREGCLAGKKFGVWGEIFRSAMGKWNVVV